MIPTSVRLLDLLGLEPPGGAVGGGGVGGVSTAPPGP